MSFFIHKNVGASLAGARKTQNAKGRADPAPTRWHIHLRTSTVGAGSARPITSTKTQMQIIRAPARGAPTVGVFCVKRANLTPLFWLFLE